jgi:hypothetical protein
MLAINHSYIIDRSDQFFDEFSKKSKIKYYQEHLVCSVLVVNDDITTYYVNPTNRFRAIYPETSSF